MLAAKRARVWAPMPFPLSSARWEREKKSQQCHGMKKIPLDVFHEFISVHLEPRDCEHLLYVLPVMQPYFHLAPIHNPSPIFYCIPRCFKFGQVRVICRDLHINETLLFEQPDPERFRGVQGLSIFGEGAREAHEGEVVSLFSAFVHAYANHLFVDKNS